MHHNPVCVSSMICCKCMLCMCMPLHTTLTLLHVNMYSKEAYKYASWTVFTICRRHLIWFQNMIFLSIFKSCKALTFYMSIRSQSKHTSHGLDWSNIYLAFGSFVSIVVLLYTRLSSILSPLSYQLVSEAIWIKGNGHSLKLGILWSKLSIFLQGDFKLSTPHQIRVRGFCCRRFPGHKVVYQKMPSFK